MYDAKFQEGKAYAIFFINILGFVVRLYFSKHNSHLFPYTLVVNARFITELLYNPPPLKAPLCPAFNQFKYSFYICWGWLYLRVMAG